MSNTIRQVNPPSAVILAEPKYPVITKEPTFSLIFSNFRWEEYRLLAGSVLVGAPFGYWAGWRYGLQGPSSRMGIFLFGTAALAQCVHDSTARLLGILPNEREVADYLAHKSGKAAN